MKCWNVTSEKKSDFNLFVFIHLIQGFYQWFDSSALQKSRIRSRTIICDLSHLQIHSCYNNLNKFFIFCLKKSPLLYSINSFPQHFYYHFNYPMFSSKFLKFPKNIKIWFHKKISILRKNLKVMGILHKHMVFYRRKYFFQILWLHFYDYFFGGEMSLNSTFLCSFLI